MRTRAYSALNFWVNSKDVNRHQLYRSVLMLHLKQTWLHIIGSICWLHFHRDQHIADNLNLTISGQSFLTDIYIMHP